LGILTAIGGFVDIGDLVTNAVVGSRFGLSLAWIVVYQYGESFDVLVLRRRTVRGGDGSV